MAQLELAEHDYGYFEAKNKPTPEFLSNYYAEKYYQQDKGQYDHHYPQEEVAYFLTLEERYFHIVSQVTQKESGSYLNIGCGEGWGLRYMHAQGWDVTGMDFSIYGCQTHNPDMAQHVMQGDIFQLINTLDKTYDYVALNNVLEHVIDPIGLVEDIKSKLSDTSVLVVNVPNDFSVVQKYALEKGYIDREFWVSSEEAPEHLNYFTLASLKTLMEKHGYKTQHLTTAWPIDLDLLHEHTNYVMHGEVGKFSHQKRIRVENFLNQLSLDKVADYYASLAALGLGRDVIGFFTR